MIRAAIGGVGSGKTSGVWGGKFKAPTGWDELLWGTRQIVTNIEVYTGRLWSILKHRFGVEVNTDRVTMLNEDETPKFYRHRGNGFIAEPQTDENGRANYARCCHANGQVSDANDLPSVLYLLDETHLHFSSRKFKDTSDAALHYMSQSRKRGDDVWLITQHPKQMDVALQRLCQEWWEFTNYAQRSFFHVALPNTFSVGVYGSQPSLLTPSLDRYTYNLDVEGVCSTYNTAAGVGMRGRKADTEKPRRGVPWPVAIGGACAVGAGICALPWLAGESIKKLHTGKNLAEMNNVVMAPAATNPPPVIPTPKPPAPSFTSLQAATPYPGGGLQLGTPTNRVIFGPPIEQEKPLRVKYLVKRQGVTLLGLDNGDRFATGDGRLQEHGRFLILDGNRVFRLPE